MADRDYARTRGLRRKKSPDMKKKPKTLPVQGPRERDRRILVFERDGWVCRGCGRKLVDMRYVDSDDRRRARARGLVPTLDHIIPKSRGGSSAIGNLQTMCGPCNNLKGALVPHLSEQDAEIIRLRAANQRLKKQLAEERIRVSALTGRKEATDG